MPNRHVCLAEYPDSDRAIRGAKRRTRRALPPAIREAAQRQHERELAGDDKPGETGTVSATARTGAGSTAGGMEESMRIYHDNEGPVFIAEPEPDPFCPHCDHAYHREEDCPNRPRCPQCGSPERLTFFGGESRDEATGYAESGERFRCACGASGDASETESRKSRAVPADPVDAVAAAMAKPRRSA